MKPVGRKLEEFRQYIINKKISMHGCNIFIIYVIFSKWSVGGFYLYGWTDGLFFFVPRIMGIV